MNEFKPLDHGVEAGGCDFKRCNRVSGANGRDEYACRTKLVLARGGIRLS